MATNPLSDDSEYGVQFDHEATLRVISGSKTINSEIKKKNISKHCDFGTLGLMDGKLWLNPYFGFDSDRNLQIRFWTLGGV